MYRNVSLKRNNSIAIVQFIFGSIMAIIFSYCSMGDNMYMPIGIAVCIELLLYYISNRKIYKTLFNFSTLFISVLFVFHFGQLLLLSFFQDIIDEFSFRIVLNYYTDQQNCYALRIMNIAFVSIALGTLVLPKTRIKNDKVITSQSILLLSKKVIWVTFPIKLLIDLLTVFKSFTIGFEPTSMWLQSLPNFIRSFGNISMIGFGLLIVALADRPQKQKRLFMFVLGYLAMLMLSGWRSENVAYLVVFAYLYLSTRQRIKWKNILVYVIAGYFMLCFVQVVADMRESTDRSVAGYSDMLSTMIFGGGMVIFDSMRELGNTGYTAESVLINWLQHFDPSLGKSYFLGLTAILPNITGIAGELTTSAAFAIQLQDYNMVSSDYYNIGGSILGEFFFNFGVVGGVIFAFFIGRIIGWFSVNTRDSIKQRQYFFLIYSIPVMFATLYWVRDSFGHLIRDVVWGILLCIVIMRSSRSIHCHYETNEKNC